MKIHVIFVNDQALLLAEVFNEVETVRHLTVYFLNRLGIFSQEDLELVYRPDASHLLE
jgi:hypothetical protein